MEYYGSKPKAGRPMQTHIWRLPEELVVHILSLSSPRDACSAAMASSIFRSAAGHELVWDRFLPLDYRGILSRAVEEVAFSSKRELVSRLCRPLLIDGGRKSFALDKLTGKNSFMLSARYLDTAWRDSPEQWDWTSHPKSRSPEVAKVLSIYWLGITWTLNVAELSPKTTYVVYYIFKLTVDHLPAGFDYTLEEADVIICGEFSRKHVFVQSLEKWKRGNYFEIIPLDLLPKNFLRARSDGCMEVTVGEFFNNNNFGDVVIKLLDSKIFFTKRGLSVEGIELRPKN